MNVADDVDLAVARSSLSVSVMMSAREQENAK